MPDPLSLQDWIAIGIACLVIGMVFIGALIDASEKDKEHD